MTEKQGGSDVRANTTAAAAVDGGGPGAEYELTGHKWFCSAPMCDLFLVLAQAPEGLSCFALPRILPDGTRNAMHLQRLKDKLGNRSNASSEIELHGALARMVGEPGRGVPTIIEMVGHTRLDCVIGTAAGMRHGVAHATWHAAHRSAFGKLLADQPLMRNVLADLCIESEAATALAMRLARAYDEAAAGARRGPPRSTASRRRSRSTTSASAGRATRSRRSSASAATATSRSPACRGSIARCRCRRSGRARATSWRWTSCARWPGRPRSSTRSSTSSTRPPAPTRASTRSARRLRAQLADRDALEARARRVVESMALALQGSLLVRHAPPAVADAFCASRLAGDGGLRLRHAAGGRRRRGDRRAPHARYAASALVTSAGR